MEKKLKILLLEDLPSDVKLIWNVLKKSGLEFERMLVETKESFIKALHDFVPDIILSDHSLPSFNSHEALSILAQSDLKIPFILVTATVSEDFAVDVIKRGADDYILKDRLERLPTAIYNSLGKSRLEKEREMMFEELKKSEFRYRQIVETAHEGIWMIDEFNKTTFVNKKMCEILEYSREEILGKENFSFMDDAGKLEVSKSLQRRKKGIVENLDVRYITKNARYIRTNISANPIFDDTGNYKGALAMVTDITEKKNLEDLLNRANNLARIGNWEVDLVKGTLYWSAITREIHEVAIDYVTDLDTAINYYKEGWNRDTIKQAIKEASEEGTPFNLELQIISSKGNERWVRTIGGAQFVDGICTRLYGSFQDIDSGKKADLEITRAYAEKNIILESIGDAFFAVDKDWIVTYWNHQADKALGIPKEEIVGHNFWEVFSKSENSLWYDKYQEAIETNLIVQFEVYYKILDKWFDVVAYPSNVGLSVYFKDVTGKKRMEQKIYEQKTEEHKKITKAVVSAQEKERAEIGEELHDNVNQLLAASQLYLDHGLTQAENATYIVKSQEYIKIAMEEIRKLSHALVGPGREEMMGLCDSIKELIQNIFFVKDIKFSFTHNKYDESESEEGLKLVIYRIFQEQLNNIIKYSEATEVEVELKNEKGDLIATIKDNGKGFDTSAKRNGIGLKNIRNRAELHNGKVDIVSSPGNGCTVSVVFSSVTAVEA